jgi:hypothetical protein
MKRFGWKSGGIVEFRFPRLAAITRHALPMPVLRLESLVCFDDGIDCASICAIDP